MTNYIDKIHELIERVNPQLYVDSSQKSFMIFVALSIGMFVLGLIISILFQAFPKLEKFAGDFGRDAKTICLGFPWFLLFYHSYHIGHRLKTHWTLVQNQLFLNMLEI